jgi:hypothetical protein
MNFCKETPPVLPHVTFDEYFVTRIARQRCLRINVSNQNALMLRVENEAFIQTKRSRLHSLLAKRAALGDEHLTAWFHTAEPANRTLRESLELLGPVKRVCLIPPAAKKPKRASHVSKM